MGRVPALCGSAAGPFKQWNSLFLCSSERNSAKPLEGFLQGDETWFGALEGVQDLEADIQSWALPIPFPSPAALAESQSLSVLTCKMRIKVAPTSG